MSSGEPNAEPVPAGAFPIARERIRVLHVDDDPDLLDLAATALEDENEQFDVVTATSGGPAMDHLEEEPVDCVVSDYQMPGMDGLDVLDAVRDHDEDLPFVLFTGKGSEEIAARAIAAGVSGYLQKQGSLDQFTVLANRIETLVDRYRAQRHVRRSLQALEAARDGIAVFDGEGRFQYVNESYASMYGYDPDDLVGEDWEHLYPESEVEHYAEEVISQLHDEGGWIGECACLRSDGSVFHSTHSISQLEEGGHVCVIHHGSVSDPEP